MYSKLNTDQMKHSSIKTNFDTTWKILCNSLLFLNNLQANYRLWTNQSKNHVWLFQSTLSWELQQQLKSSLFPFKQICRGGKAFHNIKEKQVRSVTIPRTESAANSATALSTCNFQ